MDELVLRFIPDNRCEKCGRPDYVEFDTMLCMQCFHIYELRRYAVFQRILDHQLATVREEIKNKLAEFRR